MKKGRNMKNETQRNKTNKNNGGRHESERIHFEFASPTAESVAIAGSFNDWQPNATPMIALGPGRWAKDLALPPDQYEYCLVVDGQWIADPLAKETVPNPFGGVNSVLKANGCAS
jgi:1,4-alpha-glucan branching enzyme